MDTILLGMDNSGRKVRYLCIARCVGCDGMCYTPGSDLDKALSFGQAGRWVALAMAWGGGCIIHRYRYRTFQRERAYRTYSEQINVPKEKRGTQIFSNCNPRHR